MYYECSRCGQVDRLGHVDSDDPYRPCLRCGERTRWTPAFEGQGVSF